MDKTLHDEQYEADAKEQAQTEGKKKKYIRRVYNKEEQSKIVERTLADLKEMTRYKQAACTYDPRRPDVSDRYKRNKEMLLMIKDDNEDGWSNVTSSALYRNYQAIQAEFMDADIKTRFRPSKLSDVEKLKIGEHVVSDWERRLKIRQVEDKTFQGYVVDGEAVELIDWTRIVKKVKEAKGTVKNKDKKFEELSEEEIQNLIESKEIPYKWKDYVEFDDVTKTVVQSETLFVEPGGYRFYGHYKRIRKAAIVEDISFDDFKREYENDPAVIKRNFKKLCRTGNQPAKDDATTAVNSDATQTPGLVNTLKRITFFDENFDEKNIVIQGELIKQSRLPFHRIPLIDYHFLENGDDFYTPGLAWLLDPTTREQEDLKNALLDEQKMKVAGTMLVDEMAFPDVSAALRNSGPGTIVPVPGLAESGGRMVQELTGSTARSVEAFNLLATLDDDIVQISGINPKRLGSERRVGSATEMSVMDTSSAKVIRMIITNYFKGRSEATRLVYKWIRKEYSKPLVMDINGDKVEKTEYRKILLNGYSLEYQKSDRDKLKEKRIKGYSEFTLDEDHFDLEGEPEFEIAPESIQKLTQQLEVQKAQNALPQMIQFAGDPMTVQPGMPIPPINSTKLWSWYVKTLEIPEEVLNLVETDDEEEEELAKEESQKILAGTVVVGTPGRCLAHVMCHQQTILQVIVLLGKIKKQVAEMKQQMNIKEIMDKAMMGMPEELMLALEPTSAEQAIKDIEDKLQDLIRHSEIDKLPANMPIPFAELLKDTNPPGFVTMPDGAVIPEELVQIVNPQQPQTMPPQGQPGPQMTQGGGMTMPGNPGGSIPSMPGSPVQAPNQTAMMR